MRAGRNGGDKHRPELLLSRTVVTAFAGDFAPRADAATDSPLPLLSVIVPLAPGDDDELAALLDQLAALPPSTQVIVCRCEPASAPLAPLHWPAMLPLMDVLGPAGRARQMNAGASHARGRWLWFVHADSWLSPTTLPALRAFLNDDADVLGFFDLSFRRDGPRLAALNAWGANLRSRLFGLPFGDQGLLLRATRFAELAGFDETLSCGEDHELVWAARNAGLPLRRIAAPLHTSARKYAQHGWLRTTARHLRLTFVQAWPAWRRLRKHRR
jgi:hypothetical protein